MYNNPPENLCMGCMEHIPDDANVCPVCGYDKHDYTAAGSDCIRPGTVLHDRYLVGKMQYTDRFGTRYIAYDIALDCKVTLRCCITKKQHKHFTRALADKQALLDSIKLRMNSVLNIRNLITSSEVFIAGDEVYTVSKYCNAVTLAEFVEDNGGNLDYFTAVRIMKSASAIVYRMHQRGIIHGSISPDVILISESGEVYLADYDTIAVNYSDRPTLFLRNGFAPVEFYEEGMEIGTYSDVYSVAATLYYALTGQVVPSPVDRDLGEVFPTLRALDLDVPPRVDAAIMRALNMKPEQRIRTVDELFSIIKSTENEAEELTSGGTASRGYSNSNSKTKTIPNAVKFSILGTCAFAVIIVILMLAGVFKGGTSLVKAPDCIGKNIDEARLLIQEAGFKMIITDAAVSDLPIGSVIAQGQNPGSEQHAGDFISLTLSLGSESAQGVVPNVAYDKLSEAFHALKAAGLEMSISVVENNEIAAGNIISQSIAAGTLVSDDNFISLTVSGGSQTLFSLLSVSQTVSTNPASVVFMFEGAVYAVKDTSYDAPLSEMPAAPAIPPSEEAVMLVFAGWYSSENGQGEVFSYNTSCRGVTIVYAFISAFEEHSPTPSPSVDPTPTPTLDAPTATPTPSPAVDETPTPSPFETEIPSAEPSPSEAEQSQEPDPSETPEETDDAGEG